MARLANQMKQLYAMCATALVMGRADLDGADDVGFDIELPIFTVGQTAELANIHPQTLRQYDRLGLVRPQRTDGGARRYCLRDIARLTRAQRLSQMRASTFPVSRAFWSSKKRIANCAAKSNACKPATRERFRRRP